MYNMRLSIWKLVIEIYASKCCHIGKKQRAGAFVYFVHMSSFIIISVGEMCFSEGFAWLRI